MAIEFAKAPRATATTRRFLEETLLTHRPTTASGVVLGRVLVRVIDSGRSLRELAGQTGIAHPQRKLDGRRSLLLEDLDALSAALGLSGGEILTPSVSDEERAMLREVEARTVYGPDGDVAHRAPTAGLDPNALARLAAQGLIRYDNATAEVAPDGAALL